ncbi:MAG TPA: 3-hydroxyacyl-CoA dehydrogenase NAD-binding domain-containing protein [Solirubrobacteraceae bacterium]|jgi:3-hydroxybutyryl-CoA dehydrogenase
MADTERVEQDEQAGRAGRAGSAASVIGVLGAGTMGAGIAQLAARTGARTLLFDPIPEALERGAARAREGLKKEAAKGRITPEQADTAAKRLEGVGELDALAPCELVIEAVPERIELKHELYRRLSEEIVAEECVLASNTSSLLVTAIAAAARRPERVVGMHFFNPAPVMRLLEVVAGEQSSERALALAHATGQAMGKTVIRAKDGPGFLVNRCNRPFGLEALRILQERIADIETIDRIVRTEGAFRMGPFELMDLVGVDTGFEISKSFYEQSFGEPRWRPSQITARYVAAGRYGRKSGRGYYDYSSDPYRPPDPGPPQDGTEGQAQPQDRTRGQAQPQDGPRGQAQPQDGAGAKASLLAGGVLERIVCQVINECAFALGEGVGSAQDIDTGMVLGLNYPRGPLAWADEIGIDRVLAVLDGLWEEYREERYRAAPELRRRVRGEQLGRKSGSGFFVYEAAV